METVTLAQSATAAPLFAVTHVIVLTLLSVR